MIARTIRLAALAVAFALTSLSGAMAVDLKWAHVYEEGSDYHKWALWAAEQIKEKTDGRVNISVYPASSLGKEVEI
ncbi:MAG: ABC transporter substrate-binding protein, partial [Rhodobiaceae bacterium]|nr:ABC transporter substrate-binding protein [Rhodobiaceae bacterium]